MTKIRRFGLEKTNPIQSQTKPIYVSPQTSAGGRKKAGNLQSIGMRLPDFQSADLKKQSQFAKGQISVNIYLKGNYDNIPACRHGKNKPNSKPNKANCRASDGNPKH